MCDRPKTRADCIDGDRPCPYITCRWHLFFDSRPRVRQWRKWVADALDDEEMSDALVVALRAMSETCALDVASRCGETLIEIGRYMDVTRERTRQIESSARIAVYLALRPALRTLAE